MKRFLRTALVSVRFLFLILFPVAVTVEQEYCTPNDNSNVAFPFRLLHRDVCPLRKNILHETTYDFQNHCAMKCAQNLFCVGYNFMKKQQKKTANCQLTHTLDQNFHDCNADDKGWIFYHPVGPRKIPCRKMKNCKNGGKTIIYLRDGPGSDPYRCECPEGYTGNLCQNVYSAILSGEPADFLTRLESWTGSSNTNWKLCWRATEHAWAVSTFHGNCNYKKPTVTIIKVGNFIFGGYATESWDGNDNQKQAPGSFIFSLRNKENLPPFKAPLKNGNSDTAIIAKPMHGPIFGAGHDIYISDNAASNNYSATGFDVDYQAPSDVSEAKTILGGTFTFTPSEIEVFHIF